MPSNTVRDNSVLIYAGCGTSRYIDVFGIKTVLSTFVDYRAYNTCCTCGNCAGCIKATALREKMGFGLITLPRLMSDGEAYPSYMDEPYLVVPIGTIIYEQECDGPDSWYNRHVVSRANPVTRIWEPVIG